MNDPGSSGTEVRLRGVHLCCGGCTDAVNAAVARVPGVTSRCDMDHGTVLLTARDDAAARQALDAIADAGFHGETGEAGLAMRSERNLPPGKVHALKLSGIHNCCDLCYDAIRRAVHAVSGVTADTGGPGKTAFEVAGDFSAAELLRSLNAAGFHARVQQ